jgi:hypothetical protein
VAASTGRVPEVGDRLLLACDGGPSMSRLVTFPPPLEIDVTGGVYVLVDDDGPPERWRYEFVAADP